MATINQKVLDWLYRVLVNDYSNINSTYNNVAQLLSRYSSLSPRTDVYTYDNGKSALLLKVSGTIPVVFRGTCYRFPIAIWIPYLYPLEAPLVYVIATEGMVIRPGQHVDLQGKIYHPYLVGWANNSDRFNLIDFVEILRDVFAKEPPVISRPQSSTHRGTSSLSSDIQRPVSQVSQQENNLLPPPPPPPPPPKPEKDNRQSLRSGAQKWENGPPLPPLPPSLGPSLGNPHAEIAHSNHQTHLSQGLNNFVQQKTNGDLYKSPPSVLEQSHPRDFYLSRESQRSPGPRYSSLKPIDLIYQVYPKAQLTSNKIVSPLQQDVHIQYPKQQIYSHQKLQLQPSQVSKSQSPCLKPETPPDLLSAPLALTAPLPSNTDPHAPPIPSNPEKDLLLQKIGHELYYRRQKIREEIDSTIPGLQAQRDDMLASLAKMETEIYALNSLDNLITTNTSILHTSLKQADTVILSSQHRRLPSVDELLVAPNVVANQLYDLVSEERSLGDALFVLARAVEKGRISPVVFVKMTRSLSREWYLKKALVRKIGLGMGLITSKNLQVQEKNSK
ncbi:putative escrt-i component [Erysiphe neolycopersici]|uniref:Putative escrt-i component n=1 Tax=Erysiphe neolycopersici TaxID=212602 RepID=A0A420HN69_9PEZI|nr:putative escrt-i component [Erysiphe neolycopersici]